MSYTPKRLAGLKLSQYPKLQDSEESKVYRVRAGRDVHDWLGTMTAEQRGVMLTELHGRYMGKEEPPPLLGDEENLTKAQKVALRLIRSEGLRVKRGLKRRPYLVDQGGVVVSGVRYDTLKNLVSMGLVRVEIEDE